MSTSKVISKFDIFGHQIRYNYEGSSVYKTGFGGCVSFLFVAFILVVCIGNVKLYFLKQLSICSLNFFFIDTFANKENVTSSTLKIYNPNPPSVKLNSNNFMFAIRVQQDNFITNPYFNMTLEWRDYETLQNGTKFKNKSIIPLERCTVQHWLNIPSYGENFTELTKTFDLENFLCPLIDYQLPLGGNYLSHHFEHIKITVSKCTNKIADPSKPWRPKCAADAEIAEFFKNNTVSRFQIYISNNIINPLISDQYIQSFVEDQIFFNIQNGLAYVTADIFLTESTILTDESLMPLQSIKNETIINYSSGNFRQQTNIGQGGTVYGDFFLRKDSINNSIKRSYQKISELIAYIGGLSQIFIVISSIIVNYYNESVYCLSLANKIYDFQNEDSNELQKNDNQNMNQQMDNLKQFQENKAKDDSTIRSPGPIIFNKTQQTQVMQLNQNSDDQTRIMSLNINENFQDSPQILVSKYQEQSNNNNNNLIYSKTSGQNNLFNKNNEQLGQKIDPKESTISSFPQFDLDPLKKQQMAKEFDVLLQKKTTFKISCRYFINVISCGKYCNNTQVKLLKKVKEQMIKDLDIFEMLNRIKEIEKLKVLLLEKDQHILFNFLPKPVIKVLDENSWENMSRADFADQLKKLLNTKTKVSSSDIKKQIPRKASTFKEPLKSKKSSLRDIESSTFFNRKVGRFDSAAKYEQLYNAFLSVLSKENHKFNLKLISLLGKDMVDIFQRMDKSKKQQLKEYQQSFSVFDQPQLTNIQSPKIEQLCIIQQDSERTCIQSVKNSHHSILQKKFQLDSLEVNKEQKEQQQKQQNDQQQTLQHKISKFNNEQQQEQVQKQNQQYEQKLEQDQKQVLQNKQLHDEEQVQQQDQKQSLQQDDQQQIQKQMNKKIDNKEINNKINQSQCSFETFELDCD